MTTAAQKRKNQQKKQQAVLDYVAANFGLTDAVLDMDDTNPKTGFTLKEAFDQIRRQKITDPNRAAEILAKTNWFKKYGVEVTRKLAQEQSAPGVFQNQVLAQVAAIRDRAAALGISVNSADLNKLARDAYVYGLNDSRIIDKMISSKSADYTGGGTTGETMRQLSSFAYANGVSFSKKDEDLWAMQIAGGNKTPQEYEAALREKAAQRYTVFADKIRAGENLSDLTSAYREKMASLLEVDPDDIGWDDPLMKDGKAFTTVDDKGQPAVKSLWDFEKDIKSDQRWQFTKNAREQYTNAGMSLLKRFGMVV